MRFEIVGTDNLRRAIGEIPGQVRAGMRKAMKLALGLVHRHAATIVPVRTGRLKNSLFWNPEYEQDGNTLVGIVGTSVQYAPYVELGTRRMQARPYLQPAIDQNVNTINSIFANEIGNALHG